MLRIGMNVKVSDTTILHSSIEAWPKIIIAHFYAACSITAYANLSRAKEPDPGFLLMQHGA